jgi:HPt (histidine-containing phosphotransfer) domain-containing protein
MTMKIISQLAGNEDFTPLLQQFISEIPERISHIDLALAADDVELLKRIVHQLKGACGGYGFPSLTEEAFALEKVMDNETSVKNFESELAHFVANLRLMTADPE